MNWTTAAAEAALAHYDEYITAKRDEVNRLIAEGASSIAKQMHELNVAETARKLADPQTLTATRPTHQSVHNRSAQWLTDHGHDVPRFQ